MFQDFERGFSLLIEVLSEDEAEEFSERLRRIMKKYREGLVDNAGALD